ncbi:MAG: molybdopterin-dependent oxidoreductase [Candidatus Promineifilaceae bacterium]
MLKQISRWRQRNQERRALEATMRKARRLPPGQRVTLKFPVLHIGRIPTFNPDTWTLKLYGAVEKPVKLSWKAFQQLPRQTLKIDLHCVTQWSKFDTVWEGVSLQTLIDHDLLKLNADATHMIQVAEGGYKTNLPLSIAMQENFLLATHVNGQPLEPKHGFPLRGVTGHIAGRRDLEDVYLWKGAKWLRGLKFVTKDEPGTWEVGGYHNEGDVWREERWGVRWK